MGYTHGTIWTEDLIKTQIIDVVETLGLNRFPTHNWKIFDAYDEFYKKLRV